MTALYGVRCPACGGPTAVIRVVHPAPGLTARRRRCRACGHRLTTVERVVRKEKPLPVAVAPRTTG